MKSKYEEKQKMKRTGWNTEVECTKMCTNCVSTAICYTIK